MQKKVKLNRVIVLLNSDGGGIVSAILYPLYTICSNSLTYKLSQDKL